MPLLDVNLRGKLNLVQNVGIKLKDFSWFEHLVFFLAVIGIFAFVLLALFYFCYRHYCICVIGII